MNVEQNRTEDYFQARRSSGRLRRRFRLSVIFFVGVALSLLVYRKLAEIDVVEAKSNFRAVSASLSYELEKNIGEVDHLREIGSVMEVMPRMGRKDFETVISAHLRHFSSIQALEWIPRVPNAEREAYEEAARRDGFSNFQFTERNEKGELVRAGMRGEYYPVFFVEPLKGNEVAVGYDLASSAIRREALEKSRDTGDAAATTKIRLVQERANQNGFLTFIPVYDGKGEANEVWRRRHLTGFILGVFRIGDMAENALGTLGKWRSNLDVYLFDLTAPAPDRLLYQSAGVADKGSGFPLGLDELLKHEGPIFKRSILMFDRRWEFFVLPGGAYFRSSATWKPQIGFAVGILLTSLITGYLYYLRTTALAAAAHMEEMDRANRELAKKEQTLMDMNAKVERTLHEFRKSQELLLRAEKLSSIGVLSAGVTHELLNPLNIIGIIVQGMLLDEPPADLRERLEDVMTQVRRATKITDHLRMFAHKSKPEIKLVDVGNLFNRTAALVEHQFNLDNITIRREPSADLPKIYADEDKLAQVFLNFLNNARDAMNAGKDGEIVFKAVRAADGVEVRISDNGIGIPSAMKNKIFDPFFSTKAPGKGTGLGLTTALAIIEGHNGNIRVESKDGEGATFIITLPKGAPEGAGDESGA